MIFLILRVMIVGVPDSKLKYWLHGKKYIIAVDEGEAVGMAVGYFLSTGKIGTVFMQSDGVCNALNAITSLCIPYQIPVNFVISIREDEPQHYIMGKTVKKLLEMYAYEGGNYQFIA